jgi:hypothetical protein
MAERLAAVEALRNRDLKEFAALLSAKDFEYLVISGSTRSTRRTGLGYCATCASAVSRFGLQGDHHCVMQGLPLCENGGWADQICRSAPCGAPDLRAACD